MPVFLCQLTAIDLDAGRYSDRLYNELRVQLQKAAFAFYRIATASVPVRTGFVRGAFGNLLDALGRGGARPKPHITTNVLSRTKSQFQEMSRREQSDFQSKRPYTAQFFQFSARTLRRAGARNVEIYRDGKDRILKTPQSGREFATRADQIITRRGNVLTFAFNINISYFNINDFSINPRNLGTPWRSFERGRAFFLKYMATTGIQKIPRVQGFLTEHQISVNATTKFVAKATYIDRTIQFNVPAPDERIITAED